jgi:hypothetical protein
MQRTKGTTAVSLSSVHPSFAEVMQGSAEGAAWAARPTVKRLGWVRNISTAQFIL